MASKWTHSICKSCWDNQNPDQTSYRVLTVHSMTDLCCFCGVETTSGIYIRQDPNEVPCKGVYMMHLPEEE